jgi:SulP family sulfate permease
MATIVFSALLVGILFTLLGSFRLGNLIRFVPLPVMGGFLAGVGWLLSSGAIKSMTGLPLELHRLTDLFQPLMISKWLPGLVSALVLLLLQRYRRSVFNLFMVVIATVALFWLAVWLIGVSPSTLRADGWLMAAGANQSTWTPFEYVRGFTNTDWRAVLSQLPQLSTLLVIASVSVLMAASSLELLSGRDLDLNRELMAAGLGNFACAAIGSLPGYHSLAASTLSHKMGTPVRLVGLVSAMVCAAAYGLGVSFLSVLPKLLVGTVVLYIAMSLLLEWLYDTWFKLSRGDYSILLLVFGCVSFVGLIEGVAIGLIAGVALFAFEYGRISIARRVGSSVDIRSNVVYSEAKHSVLREHGNESHIVELQGFIFFGTANRLLSQVRSRMLDSGEPSLRCVVLDFKRVFGLDSSAALSFLKLRQYAENSGFVIALSDLLPQIDNSLKVAGTYEGSLPCIRKFEDLDHALEYCEKIILSANLLHADEEICPIAEQLRRAFTDGRQAAAFEEHLRYVTLSKGDYLVRQGDDSDDLFFIERGRVAVVLEKAGAAFLRINSMGPGTVVGETAFFLGLPRSASVIAEAETAAYRLTRQSLDTIAADDPELVIAFHGFIVRMLAERLIDANRVRSDRC